MIVCCSPAAFNVEETIGTLRFAARAKLIKNVIKVQHPLNYNRLCLLILTPRR